MHCWGRPGWGISGGLFPDTDPAYAGADSLQLLQVVAQRVAAAGYSIGNIDATLLAQQPKLKPYIPAMRERLAAACGVPVPAVSVKATTRGGAWLYRQRGGDGGTRRLSAFTALICPKKRCFARILHRA